MPSVKFMNEYETKSALLTAILKHVPFEGWTEEALHHAATEVSIPSVSLPMLFPQGITDVIDFFITEADREMTEAIARLPLQGMKIRERITSAITLRLEQAEPHRIAIRRAISHYALPHHTSASAHALWRTADTIWYAIGDNATDYNYYTKRALLSAVYSSTLLFWLDDHSENHSETWQFLDRRIANVMEFGKVTAMLKNPLGQVKKLWKK